MAGDEVGTFVVNRLPWLVAVGNDVLLTVDRSDAMSVTDPAYRPIADHIADHGMVLVERTKGTDERMTGRIEKSWYATPTARNLLLMDAEEASA